MSQRVDEKLPFLESDSSVSDLLRLVCELASFSVLQRSGAELVWLVRWGSLGPVILCAILNFLSGYFKLNAFRYFSKDFIFNLEC